MSARCVVDAGVAVKLFVKEALSVRVAAPLITADQRMLRSVLGKPFGVLALALVDPLDL